jgi:thymidylate synthase
LEDKGINFWKGNTSREFLDARGLVNLPEGDMGKGYGFQFRNFGGISANCPNGKQISYGGHDQLYEVFAELFTNPYSRRLYTTFWNPSQSHEMALTPCWHSHRWVVLPDGEGRNVLNLKLINGSLDSVFGLSFAVQQYALYQVAMANLLGMKVGKLACDLSHVHIYKNQMEYAEELVRRELGKAGEVSILKPLHCLSDLVTMQWSDVEVEGLEVNSKPFSTPRPPMAV